MILILTYILSFFCHLVLAKETCLEDGSLLTFKVNGSLLSLAHQMQHFYVPITKTMSGWKLSGAEYQKQKAQQEYNLQNNHVHK